MSKFFKVIIILFLLLCAGCHDKTPDNIKSDSLYGMAPISIMESKCDTISIFDFNTLVNNKILPPKKYWQMAVYRNPEENLDYKNYVYMDFKSGKIFTLKEIVNRKDTIYILLERNYIE